MDTSDILFAIFMELLADADIASDFVYYNSIKDNKDINIHKRKAVFAFCIIGAFFLAIEKYYALLTWLVEDVHISLKMFCYITSVFEDFPMLIILLTIRQETGEVFNIEGKISFWLAVTSMFFKVKKFYYYYIYLGRDEAETTKSASNMAGYCQAICYVSTIIIIFFALHPTLWDSKKNSNHSSLQCFNQSLNLTFNQSLNLTLNQSSNQSIIRCLHQLSNQSSNQSNMSY